MASINLGGRGATSFLNRAVQQNAKAHAKGLSAQRYKKLLLVCKQTRLERFQKKGIDMSPYIK